MRKKLLFATICCFNSYFMLAQNLSNPNLQSMINTELAFAKLANDSNTRIAFLTYLADQSVMFNKGQVQDGKKLYESKPVSESLLVWEPIFADISASGDLGYDTGPWELKLKRTDEKPAYFGDFVSIWRKQSDGNWKLALDLGISHSQPTGEKPKLTVSKISLKEKFKDKKDFKTGMLDVENKLVLTLNNADIKLISNLISKEARFFREGIQPLITSETINEMLKSQFKNQKITYSVIDGFVASSGDFGYVYGNATIESKVGNETKIHKGNYQRVWKKEDGKNWKIIADVIVSD